MSASHVADTKKTIDRLVEYQGGDVCSFDHLYGRLPPWLLRWARVAAKLVKAIEAGPGGPDATIPPGADSLRSLAR